MKTRTFIIKGDIGDLVYSKETLQPYYVRGVNYEAEEQLPHHTCYWVSHTPNSGSVYLSGDSLLSKEEYRELLESKLKELK